MCRLAWLMVENPEKLWVRAMKTKYKYGCNNMLSIVPVSLAQLVGTLHNLCRGRGSNPGHPTSPHLIV